MVGEADRQPPARRHEQSLQARHPHALVAVQRGDRHPHRPEPGVQHRDPFLDRGIGLARGERPARPRPGGTQRDGQAGPRRRRQGLDRALRHHADAVRGAHHDGVADVGRHTWLFVDGEGHARDRGHGQADGIGLALVEQHVDLNARFVAGRVEDMDALGGGVAREALGEVPHRPGGGGAERQRHAAARHVAGPVEDLKAGHDQPADARTDDRRHGRPPAHVVADRHGQHAPPLHHQSGQRLRHRTTRLRAEREVREGILRERVEHHQHLGRVARGCAVREVPAVGGGRRARCRAVALRALGDELGQDLAAVQLDERRRVVRRQHVGEADAHPARRRHADRHRTAAPLVGNDGDAAAERPSPRVHDHDRADRLAVGPGVGAGAVPRGRRGRRGSRPGACRETDRGCRRGPSGAIGETACQQEAGDDEEDRQPAAAHAGRRRLRRTYPTARAQSETSSASAP